MQDWDRSHSKSSDYLPYLLLPDRMLSLRCATITEPGIEACIQQSQNSVWACCISSVSMGVARNRKRRRKQVWSEERPSLSAGAQSVKTTVFFRIRIRLRNEMNGPLFR